MSNNEQQTIRNIIAILNKHGVQSAISAMDNHGKIQGDGNCRFGNLMRKFAVACIAECKHIVESHRDLINAISIAKEYADNSVKLSVVSETRKRAENVAIQIESDNEASILSYAAEACVNVLLDDAYEAANKAQRNVRFALAKEMARKAIAATIVKTRNLSSETLSAIENTAYKTAFNSVQLMIKGLLQQILESELKAETA